MKFFYDMAHVQCLQQALLHFKRKVGSTNPGVIIAILLTTIVMAGLLVVSPELMLAVALAGFVIAATIISPYAGMLIMVSFIFLRPAERFPALHMLYPVRGQAMLLVCIWLLQRHLRSKKLYIKHPVMTTFAIGAAIIAASAFGAIWKQVTVGALGDTLFTLLTLCVIIDQLNTEVRFKRYLWLLIGLATFLSIEQISMFTQEAELRARGQGTALQDSNDFGLAMLFFLPFAFYTARCATSRAARWTAISICLLIVASIVATHSRGTAIGFAVVSIALWAKSQQKVLAGIAMVLLLITVWVMAPPSYRERVMSIGNYQNEENATVRTNAWKAGFSMFLKRPLFGVGAKNFQAAYWTQGFVDSSGPQWRAAHSIYVQALAELGAAGFVWLLVLVILIFKSAKRARLRLATILSPPGYLLIAAHSVEVGLIGVLAAGAFLSCLDYPYLPLLGSLAIALDLATARLQQPVITDVQGEPVIEVVTPVLPAHT